MSPPEHSLNTETEMGVEKISFANGNHNKDRLIILISVKVDFEPKKIIREKEYFKKIIKNNKAYEFVSENRVSIYMKQKQRELKE